MVKSYNRYNNKEVVAWVTYDQEPAVAVSSFFKQTPSHEILECVEDTIVERIDYKALQEMIQLYPDLNAIYHHFILDFLDADDDGDGLATHLENADPNQDGSPSDAFDADNDGISDYLDLNSYVESASVDTDIEVYNAMSPNGDGLNDVFTIRNIELYPDNTLTIFNRWGNVIYEVANYGQYNRYFDGRSANGTTVPVGTYFYSLKVKNYKEKVIKGYLYINK